MARKKIVPCLDDNGQAAEKTSPFGSTEPTESAAPTNPPETPLDPFDPRTYKLQPALLTAAGVEKHIVELTIRKPDKSWWFRVNPDPEYILPAFVIELKEEAENYLVLPPLWQSLHGEPTFVAITLYLAVTRQGKLFLWPVKRPIDPDQQPSRWLRPTLDAVSRATTKWTRICWNTETRQHDVSTSKYAAEPEWPDVRVNSFWLTQNEF
jgi:hypothetical protein